MGEVSDWRSDQSGIFRDSVQTSSNSYGTRIGTRIEVKNQTIVVQKISENILQRAINTVAAKWNPAKYAVTKYTVSVDSNAVQTYSLSPEETSGPTAKKAPSIGAHLQTIQEICNRTLDFKQALSEITKKHTAYLEKDALDGKAGAGEKLLEHCKKYGIDMFAEGKKYVKDKDLTKAAMWFRLAASSGNAEAAFELGKMHRDGIGMPPNQEKAKELFLQGTKQLHEASAFELGQIYKEQIKEVSSKSTFTKEEIALMSQWVNELKALGITSRSLAEAVFSLDAMIHKLPDTPDNKSLRDESLSNVRQTKQLLKLRSTHRAVSAAAEKGVAAQASTRLMGSLASSKGQLTTTAGSANPVYVREKEGAVLKKSSPRAREEEMLVGEAWQLMSERGFVSAFGVEKPTTPLSEGSFKLTDCHPDIQAHFAEACRRRNLNPKDARLVPDLSTRDKQIAFITCSKAKYPYTFGGKTTLIDFATLRRLIMQQGLDVIAKRVDWSKLKFTAWGPGPTPEQLEWVLSPANQVLEDSRVSHVKKDQWGREENTPLSGVDVKPYVQNMFLAGELDLSTLQEVSKRLTSEGEFNLVLSGEIGLYDMHASNVGFAPEPTEAYNQFKDVKFSLSRSSSEFNEWGAVDFKNLWVEYSKGNLRDKIISYKVIEKRIEKDRTGKDVLIEEARIVSGRLSELPDLQKALDTKWRPVFFDLDRSIPEDNELHLLNGQATLPVRSALFDMEAMRDKPLSDTCIAKLMQSAERDRDVQQWMGNHDAPVFKQMSAEGRGKVQAALDPLVERYSLSEMRRTRSGQTRLDLAKQFATDLSDLSKPENKAFWELVEAQLSSRPVTVSVQEGDTWEKLAERHGRNAEELKKLNAGKDLSEVDRINIGHVLTQNTPEGVKERNQLAVQFFPKLTVKQQTAMKQRQASRTQYLTQYEQLKQTKATGKELKKEMQTFLNSSSCPLATSIKERLLRDMATKDAKEIQEELLGITRPTYANVMRAMYPLLADTQELAKDVVIPGSSGRLRPYDIGYDSMDKLIEAAQNAPHLKPLADKLVARMVNKRDIPVAL